jgi:hypothetical protein
VQTLILTPALRPIVSLRRFINREAMSYERRKYI